MAKKKKRAKSRTRPKASPAPSASITNGDPLTVSAEKQVAAVYGVHVNTVQNWKKAPWPCGTKGPYDLAVIGKWYRERIEKERQRLAAAGEADDSDDADVRDWKRYRAELLRMEVELKKGELLPRDEVYETCGNIFTRISTALDAAGRRLGSRHGPKAAKVLEAAMETVLADIDRDIAAGFGAKDQKPGEGPEAPDLS